MSMDPGGKPPLEERIVRPNQLIPWTAVVGSVLTGLIGIGGALGSLSAGRMEGTHYIGAGACLTASALAFGLLCNAIFRT